MRWMDTCSFFISAIARLTIRRTINIAANIVSLTISQPYLVGVIGNYSSRIVPLNIRIYGTLPPN